MGKIRLWFDIIRPRTLPASVAGVLAASVYAASRNCLDVAVAGIALLFALAAQITSNIANDYFDYKAGFDGEDRVGPQRHLTKGDVTLLQVKVGAVIAFVLAASAGLFLLAFTGYWWLLLPGVVICLASLAYSGGPFPLARYGLGDVAVFAFFGLAAVCLTYYMQSGTVDLGIILLAAGVGLATDNILVVNNYRDYDEDMKSGKKTVVVRFGRKFGERLYYWNGVLAAILAVSAAGLGQGYGVDEWLRAYVIMCFYLLFHSYTHQRMKNSRGFALNSVLADSGRNLMIYVAVFAVILLTDTW